MGTFLRLAVFILALGTIAAGTAAMLLRESHRQRSLERLLTSSIGRDHDPLPDSLHELRASHVATQRALLLFGGLALGCVVALALVPTRATTTPPSSGALATNSQMRGIETLARATATQRIELDHEREARHRSEQDLTLQQLLANRALQDKVRLGRDLHDGLVQTLYATGLVLETASQRLAATPPAAAEATRLLERAKTTLNAAIREARSTIGELTPDILAGQSFADAVATLLEHLNAGRSCVHHVDLSPDLPIFVEPARTELLQIIRETTSNALRHGSATRLDLHFAPRSDGALQLTIRDNGIGFDLATSTQGHGLKNLAARASVLGATLTLDTSPGHGTTLTLTLPALTDGPPTVDSHA